MGSTRDDATALSADLTELRHAIHREPEIGLDLPRTQAKVLGALEGLPLEVTRGEALTLGHGGAARQQAGRDGAAAR